MTTDELGTPSAAATPVHDHDHVPDWATIGFGLLIVAAGAYFVLRDSLHLALPEIAWDTAWPVIVLVVGLLAVVRGASGGHRHRRRRS